MVNDQNSGWPLAENPLMAAVKSDDAQFPDTGGDAMKIEADTSAARATHYSVFDRTPAGIDDPDLAGDLDHLAASLDYLDCHASAQKSLPQ
jgi:hypothetical protein